MCIRDRNITTGGPTENGKEFVIAVIDDGFLTNHEDFADIFFINNNEIPNDGKDNDGNGYIDDYSGYNVKPVSYTHLDVYKRQLIWS